MDKNNPKWNPMFNVKYTPRDKNPPNTKDIKNIKDISMKLFVCIINDDHEKGEIGYVRYESKWNHKR